MNNSGKKMANRTVKFMGYTTDNTNVVFNFNGAEVFSGAIAPSGDSENLTELFTFDVDQTLNGNISGTVTTNGGELIVVALKANYSDLAKASFTNGEGEVIPEVTADDVINTYEWFDTGSNTSKENIVIDGDVYDKGDVSDLDGAWHIQLTDGQSMTCDWKIEATPTP
jgi:hypothetical protein